MSVWGQVALVLGPFAMVAIGLGCECPVCGHDLGYLPRRCPNGCDEVGS